MADDDDKEFADDVLARIRALYSKYPTTHYVLDEHGEPQPEPDFIAWAAWFEAASRDGSRVIAHDRDERPGAPDVLVSTVFLGTAFVLFETMILGGVHDGYQRRYATRAEALDGHRIACALVNETEPDKGG